MKIGKRPVVQEAPRNGTPPFDKTPAARWRIQVVLTTAVAVTLLGLVVLIGWALDILILKSLLPGLVTMKANTALAFALSGASLGLSILYATYWSRLLCRLLASTVALIGGLTLSQYLIGWDLGIDQLLFAESVGALAAASPGRMALSTTLNFLLIGLALQLLSSRHSRLAQALAITAGLIGLLAFLGYWYGAATLYGFGAYTAMAIHTSLAFVVLSLAVLLARPDHALAQLLASRTSAGVLARWMLPASLLLPFGLGWLRQFGENSGYYDGSFGLAIMVVLMIVCLTLLIWFSAQSIERTELERLHTLASLKTTAARFTNIVNLAADAIISVDEDQRILIFNQGAERIFGYTAAELVGQPLDMLLPARFTGAHREHVRRFATEPDAARDMSRRAEIHGRRKDGTEFPAEASISKVKENGNIQFTVFLRDISARKRVEEEIRRLNTDLERKVIERTAELAAANQELEAFSYSVSHDLARRCAPSMGSARRCSKTTRTSWTNRAGIISTGCAPPPSTWGI